MGGTATDKPRGSKFRRWARAAAMMLLAVMILPFVGLAVYILVCDGAGQREYEALLSELRAKGLPVEASDLAAPPVLDDQNAAVLYREAMDRLGEILKVAEEDTLGPPAPDHHFSVMSFTWIFQRSSTASPKSLQWFNRVLAPYTIEPSPKDVKALRAAIADCREALSLIEEGSRRPFCRFGASDEELTSYALRLAYLGTLLTGRARLRVLEGDIDAATGDILTALRLSRSLMSQPSFVMHIVGGRCEGFVLTQLYELPLRDRETIDALDVEIQAVSARDDFARALAAERIQDSRLFDTQIRDRHPILGMCRAAAYADVDELKAQIWHEVLHRENHPIQGRHDMVRAMSQFEELADLPYGEAAEGLRSLAQGRDGVSASDLVWRSRRRLLRGSGDREARLEVARAGLAVQRRRLDRGRYPDQLPGDFIDPFDGNPLRYRVDGDAAVIWSMGQDLADDGGAPTRALSHFRRRRPDGDIVWRIVAPSAQEKAREDGESRGPETDI